MTGHSDVVKKNQNQTYQNPSKWNVKMYLAFKRECVLKTSTAQPLKLSGETSYFITLKALIMLWMSLFL